MEQYRNTDTITIDIGDIYEIPPPKGDIFERELDLAIDNLDSSGRIISNNKSKNSQTKGECSYCGSDSKVNGSCIGCGSTHAFKNQNTKHPNIAGNELVSALMDRINPQLGQLPKYFNNQMIVQKQVEA